MNIADPRDAALKILASRGRGREGDRQALLGRLDRRDRKFARQLVSGTQRMRGLIDYYLGALLRDDPADLPADIRNLLRISLFQIGFLDRVPDYAAVNEAVEKAATLCGGRYKGLVNGVLRSFLRRRDKIGLPNPRVKPVRYLATRYSHPVWMVERYLERFGFDATACILEANNREAPLNIRSEPEVRGDSAGGQRLRELLESSGVTVRPGSYLAECLVLDGVEGPPTELGGYEEGLFYVQDEAAMLAGRLCATKPGSLVCDLCAAPGGKATHAAGVLGGTGMVAACDSRPGRLRRLASNAARLGLGNLYPVATDALAPAVGRADLVICDVPCTGTGVIRRRPDLRWNTSPEDLRTLTGIQRGILRSAAGLLRAGGVLVYSTCSLEPEENMDMVDWFLGAHPSFALQPANGLVDERVVNSRGCLELLPHVHGTDGAFAARLVRRM